VSDLPLLKALLLDRIDALIGVLNLPEPAAGTRRSAGSRELRFGHKGSLVIHVAGRRAGSWRSFEDGVGGDLIALIAWARGISQGEAIAWAKGWLGLADGTPPAPPKAPATSLPPRSPSASAAQRLWQARRDPRGTTVEHYLAGRGLTLPDPCPQLGYAPDLAYRNGAGVVTGHFPAMLAAIRGADGRLIGVHRTYLAVRRTGSVRKAPVPAAKKVLGSHAGGAVRLTAAPGATLALAEGIETALAVAQATGWPTWAVVAVENFARVVLPGAVRTVILCGDADEPDLAARIVEGREPVTPAGRCLARAAGRFRRHGIEVRLEIPRTCKSDWNDVLGQRGAPAG
jgi:hypothetical protein